MRTLVGTFQRAPAAGVLLGLGALLSLAVVSGHGAKAVAPMVLALGLFTALYRRFLKWHSLVGLIVVVVMFVPVGLYQFAANLPFNLELYRVVVALVTLIWISALLVDSTVQLRSTVFDKPLLLIVACILASEIVNEGRVQTDGTHVVKSLTFFLSFVLVYYVTATAINRREAFETVIKLLVACGGFVGASAVIEERRGYNIFNHLQTIFPFLQFQGGYANVIRGGNLRVFGSAQHPIALGAAMAVLLPLSVYLVRTSGRRWLIATLLILLGALASGSRTFMTMAIAELVVYLRLKPRETRRLWPLLVPLVVVVHVFLPGLLGSLKQSFFPKGGIVAEQTQLVAGSNAQLAGGRLRQISPMLTEASHHWPFGEGYGTRISGFDEPDRNAPILDNQWLNNVLDIGYIGVGFWIWLFARALRRLMRASRQAEKDGDDWLFAGFAASLAAFAIGMLTFDAFDFTQVFFLFWILLALAAGLLRITPLKAPEATRSISHRFRPTG